MNKCCRIKTFILLIKFFKTFLKKYTCKLLDTSSNNDTKKNANFKKSWFKLQKKAT